MVSATESLYGTDAVLSVDPYVDNGIEEAEITTCLLYTSKGTKIIITIVHKFQFILEDISKLHTNRNFAILKMCIRDSR